MKQVDNKDWYFRFDGDSKTGFNHSTINRWCLGGPCCCQRWKFWLVSRRILRPTKFLFWTRQNCCGIWSVWNKWCLPRSVPCLGGPIGPNLLKEQICSQSCCDQTAKNKNTAGMYSVTDASKSHYKVFTIDLITSIRSTDMQLIYHSRDRNSKGAHTWRYSLWKRQHLW